MFAFFINYLDEFRFNPQNPTYRHFPTYGQFTPQTPQNLVIINAPVTTACNKCGGSGFKYRKGRQKRCIRCNGHRNDSCCL